MTCFTFFYMALCKLLYLELIFRCLFLTEVYPSSYAGLKPGVCEPEPKNPSEEAEKGGVISVEG